MITYKVEIALGDVSPAPFKLDLSDIGSGDQIPGGAALDVSSTLTDVTLDCERFRFSRGRDEPQGEVNPGEATIVLFDETGKYNPSNPDSIYYGYLRPMRKVVISGSLGGGDPYTPIFTGFIHEMEHDANKYSTTIVAKDLMQFLDSANPVFNLNDLASPRTGHILINAVVQATGWADTDIDTSAKGFGLAVEGFEADGTQTALELISDALATDFGGGFYLSRESVWTWLPGGSGRLPTALLYETYRGTLTGATLDGVVNRAIVTRTSPNGDFEELPQTFEDTFSQDIYGVREVRIESPYFNSDFDTAELAERIVTQRAYTAHPVYGLSIPGSLDDGLTSQLLRLDLMDSVVVASPLEQTQGTYRVESIEWEVPRPGEDVIKLGLSVVPSLATQSYYGFVNTALSVNIALPITRR